MYIKCPPRPGFVVLSMLEHAGRYYVFKLPSGEEATNRFLHAKSVAEQNLSMEDWFYITNYFNGFRAQMCFMDGYLPADFSPSSLHCWLDLLATYAIGHEIMGTAVAGGRLPEYPAVDGNTLFRHILTDSERAEAFVKAVRSLDNYSALSLWRDHVLKQFPKTVFAAGVLAYVSKDGEVPRMDTECLGFIRKGDTLDDVNLPCGKVYAWEGLARGAAREVFEETGLSLARALNVEDSDFRRDVTEHDFGTTWYGGNRLRVFADVGDKNDGVAAVTFLVPVSREDLFDYKSSEGCAKVVSLSELLHGRYNEYNSRLVEFACQGQEKAQTVVSSKEVGA